jgi:hypothetical protein
MGHSKSRKKLRLNAEVLRNLTPAQAGLVAGGVPKPSDNPAACRVSTNDPTACRYASSNDPLACRAPSSGDPAAC